MQQGGGFGRKGVGAIPASRSDDIAAKREAFLAAERKLGTIGESTDTQRPRYQGPGQDDYARARAMVNERYAHEPDHSAGFGDAQLERSMGIAYLCWFFLGQISMHRFYLGAIQSGMVQAGFFVVGLALVFTASAFSFLGMFLLVLWALWVLLDLFLIPGLHRRFCRQ